MKKNSIAMLLILVFIGFTAEAQIKPQSQDIELGDSEVTPERVMPKNDPDHPPTGKIKINLPNKFVDFSKYQPTPPPGFKPILNANDPRRLAINSNTRAVAYFNGPSLGGIRGITGLLAFNPILPKVYDQQITHELDMVKQLYPGRTIVADVFNAVSLDKLETWAKEKLEQRLEQVISFEKLFPELTEDEALLPSKTKVRVGNPNGFQPYVGDLLVFGEETEIAANTTIIKKIAEDGDDCLVRVVYQRYFGGWTTASDLPTMINLVFLMPKKNFTAIRNSYFVFVNAVSLEHANLELALKSAEKKANSDKARIQELLRQDK